MRKESTKLSLVWKLLERFAYHGIKLLVQIILARILAPSDFGVLSIIIVFIDIATIFVQSGLNTALIQNKNATDNDFSTVFWFSILFAVLLYGIVFITAPIISNFFENQSISSYLRFLGIMLIGGAINSIQIAYSSRNNNFRAQFICNLIAVVLSGALAVVMAYSGYGIWALIVQQIIWQYLMVILMEIAIKWKPKFVFSVDSLKKMFSFGWKMLLSSLLIRVNIIISNLIIGKKYTDNDLGYYSKAQSFPTVFSDVAVTAISSVALVDFSKKQGDIDVTKKTLKKYLNHTMFFVAPIMFGLIAIAEPFVSLLLTDKWLGCVDYLRIFCLMYLFQPVCAIYGQAISGYGRNDLYLKAYLIAKPIGLLLIFASAFLFDSPIYIAFAVLLTSIIEMIAQSINVKKVFNMGYISQLKSWLPCVVMAIVMFIVCYLLTYLTMSNILLLLIQVIVGGITYLFLCFLTKNEVLLAFISKLKKLKNGDTQ